MVRFVVFIISIIFFASCAPQNLTYERVYSFVLGQLSLESNFNRIALYPKQTLIVGSKFIVVDQYNSRVLIWNDKSNATRGTAADVVLGQPNLSEFFANNEGLSDKSLNNPVGVTSDGTKLFVSDTENNRILIWNTIPTTDFQAANMVLGQPDFISNGANNGVPTLNTSLFAVSIWTPIADFPLRTSYEDARTEEIRASPPVP